MKAPSLFYVGELKNVDQNQCGLPDGRWVPARPISGGGMFDRIRLAWMVFVGKADALRWPGQ